MANKITLGVGFNVDKTSLNTIKTELQQLKSLTGKDYLKIRPDLDFGDAVTEVNKLKESISSIEQAFAKSFNVNLGSTNVSTLRKELQSLNLNEIAGQFKNLGSRGVQAWQSITSSILGSNLQLQKTETLLDKMATTMGNTIKWGIASSAMNTFTGSVQKAYGYVKNLDKSLNDIRIVSGQTADQMADFAVQANKAASSLGATTLDYTNASLIFYQQGLAGEEVVKRADAVVKMVNATGDSADKVSSYMTAVWNNFADGSQNLEYYADVMAKLGAATAASTEEIAAGLEKFAAVAETVGLSYEYATAAIATVVSETRQSADVVGTAFRTLFARMEGLSLGETLEDGTTLNKYSEALASVGVNIKNQNGELKEMDTILSELGNKWDTLSDDTQIALAQTVAGVRQYNQMIALMDNWDKVEENIVLAANSTGELQKQQDIYMDSLEGHLNKLSTAQEGLYDTLFDSESFKDILDTVTGLVEGLTDFVDAIGGGGNALLMLGTIATKVFDKQIAQGLTTMINNSKIAATNMQALSDKQAELDSVASAAKTKATSEKASIGDKVAFEGSVAAADEHRKMMGHSDILSPESIEQGEALIKVYSEAVAKAEELKLKQQEAAQTLQNFLQLQGQQTDKTNQDFINTIASGEAAETEEIMESFNAAMDETKDNLQSSTKYAKAFFKEYLKGGDTASKVEEDLQKEAQKLKEELKQIKPILSKDLKKSFEDLEDVELDIFNIDEFKKQCDNIIQIGEQAFTEIEQQNVQVQDALTNANQQSISVVNAQVTAAKGSLDSYFANLDLTSTIKGVTDVTSAVGGLFTAWNAMQGLGSIWSNEDLTLAEKFAQTMFLTTTIVTSLAPAIKGLQTAYKAYGMVKAALYTVETAENREKAISVILEGKDSAAKMARWIATKLLGKELTKEAAAEGVLTGSLILNTAAQMASNVAKAIGNALHGDFSGLAIVAAGAIALGTVALIANTSAQNKDNEAKEKANKLESALTESNNQLTEAYNKLKDSFNAYDTAVDKLESCIKGTKEWKEALLEVNDAALEVINNMPNNVNVADMYHRDKDTGQIVIDEDKMGDVLDTSKMQKAASDFAVAAGSYHAEIDQARAAMVNNADKMMGWGDELLDINTLGLFKNQREDILGDVLTSDLEGWSEKITSVEDAFGKFGINMDDISNGALEDWKNDITEAAEATEAAAEKMKLVAGLKVDEVLGDEYGAAEKAIATEELTNQQNKIYEDIMSKQALEMAKSSNASNDYYQELASRLNEATGGQYSAATGNTVMHNDENRTLVFEDINGEKTEELSIEWVAQTIAAYEAMEQVGVAAEEATTRFNNLEDSLSTSFSDETAENLTSGIKNFIVDGNVENLSEEDYETLSSMSKGDLMEAMGYSKWNPMDYAEFDKMFGEKGYAGFQDALTDYETALETFTENLYPNVQTAFEALENTEGMSVHGQKAIAQALQDAMIYGGEDALNSLSSMFSKMSADQLKDFEEVTSGITDWGSTNAVDLRKALEDADIATDHFTDEQLEAYVRTMREAANVTLDFNNIATKYAEVMKIASGLKQGDTISQENYEKLGDAAEGYFTRMLDGTYKLTKDASDFYDTIKQDKVKDFEDSLVQQRDKIKQLKGLNDANYDMDSLSQQKGENHQFRDTMYDFNQNVFGGITGAEERENLSLEEKQEKNLSWQDTTGLEQQIELLKVLGDTEQAVAWETKMANDELSNTDYEEIATAVKGLKDEYGDLDTAVEALSNTYREDWLALLTSAEDLDEMKSMMNPEDWMDEAAVSAYTEAYEQMREAQRMEGLDVDAMEDYAKYLQEISDTSKDFSDDLKDNEEGAEDLATQIMRMNKGVKTLADGWEDWSDVLENSSEGSQEYFEAMNNVKGAMSDILDIDKDFMSAGFIKENMEDIEKAANGDADAIDRLRAAALEDIVLNMKLENSSLSNEQLWAKVQELQTMLDGMGPITAGTEIDLSGIDAGETEFINKLNEMIVSAGMSADQVNALLAGMGFTANFAKEPQKVQIKEPDEVTTHHRIANRKTTTMEDGSTAVEWDDITTTSTKPGKIVEGEVDAYSMETSEPGTTVVPKIESLTAMATGSANNYSSTNKGGGSPKKSSGSSSKPKTKDKKDKQSDRYHKVETQITKTDNKLSKLQKRSEKLFGGDLIENLTQQWELLNEQIDNYNEKLKIAQQEQQELREELAAQGVTFNEDGTIANYNEILAQQGARVDALIDQYNRLSVEEQKVWDENKTIENAEKQYEELEKNMDRYDELVSDFIPGIKDSIQEALDQQIELQIETFNAEIQIHLDLKEAKKEWNEFKKKIIDGIKEDDILGNAKAGLEDYALYYNENGLGVIQQRFEHIRELEEEIEEYKNSGSADFYGDHWKQLLADYKEAADGLMGDMTEVHELTESIYALYIDLMDQAQEAFDEQIESYSTISDLIEHDKNLIALVYGEESYQEFVQFYEKQHQNNLAELDFIKQRTAFWKEQMDAAEEGTEEFKIAKENWTSSIMEGQEKLQESIQNIQDDFLNEINIVFDEINNKLTNNKGLEGAAEEWELINREADMYLDSLNSLYQMQELESKYLDAIDMTDSLSSQQELNSLMEQELKMLKDKDKLTQYDIDRANLRYEIALKQIALQEAQQNKSSMRLRRDSQGNYSYQYVADDDQVSKAQQELTDLYNQLYNLDKDRYRENLGEIYDVWAEFQEQMKAAQEINDPQERLERELYLQDHYGKMINDLTAQNEDIKKYLYESSMSHLFDLYSNNQDIYAIMTDEQRKVVDAFLTDEVDMTGAAYDNLFGLYNANLEGFRTMTDEQKDIWLKDLLPAWTSGYQDMADKLTGPGGFAEIYDDLTQQLHDAADKYQEKLKEIEEQSGTSMEAIKSGYNEAIPVVQSYLTENDKLVQSYKDQFTELNKILESLESLKTAYDDIELSAKDALIAIQKFYEEELKQEAERTKKEKEKLEEKINEEKEKGAGGGNPPTQQPPVTTPTQTDPSKDGILNIGDTVTFASGKYYADSYGHGSSGSKNRGGKVKVSIINSNPFGYHITDIYGGALGWVKKSQLTGFDTGGYTGDWSGEDGRLAMLHKKEIILNKADTVNLLNAVEIIRDITSNLGQSMLSKLGAITAGNIAQANGAGDILEQNVHIDAQFPNVTNSKEIENAINNLMNIATQRIGRR